MKKPFKLPLIVSSVLTLLFLVGHVVMAFIVKIEGTLLLFKFPFEGNFAVVKALLESTDLVTWLYTGGGFALVGILLVLMVIALIKVRPGVAKLTTALLCLLCIVPAFYAVCLGSYWVTAIVAYLDLKATSDAVVLMTFMALGVFAVIFAILTFFVAMLFTARNNSSYSFIVQDAVEPVAEEAPVEEAPAPVEPAPEEVTTADAVEPVPEPVPVFIPEPEPEIELAQPEPEVEPEPEPEPVVEEPVVEETPAPAPVEHAPAPTPVIDPNVLTALLKDVVRDIVRDEIARNNLSQPAPTPATDNHSIVGATFGGPLVVQYFNGGINGVTPTANIVPPAPAPAPAPVEPAPVEPAPAPASVEPAPVEPAPAPVEPAPAPAPVVKPAPVVEPAKVEEPKAPIIRIPFQERLISAEKEMQDNYNELKNEILSWGVKSRVSNSGDTFRLHRKTYIKLTIAGKSLKLYFALNPEDYRDSAIPVQDAGEKNIYAEIPLVFKVKSGLSLRRCKQLIQDVMEKDSLEQGEVGTVNWVKELKAEMKAAATKK